MRLGQLARKLEVRPIEIVEFLATQNIVIENGANAKIDEAQATLALQHFAPHLHLTDVPDTDTQTVETVSEAPVAEIEPGKPDNDTPIADETGSKEKPEQIEVIKAPKVELSGLKVLGKINLPEPKKKQPETPQENTPSEPPGEIRKGKRNENFKRHPKPAKNPIAIQREREALEARKKREEELKLQKERRTQNYLKKVKPQQPTKAAKIVKEQAEELSPAQLEEPPKTWWGKFLRWLTT